MMRRDGLSITDIAELTGFDRKTVRKWLREPGPPRYGPRAPRGSKLAPYTAYLDERLNAGVWNAVILLREVRERGYTGGYSILKAYLHPKRQAARAVAVRRFETPPGHQAQVDWGHLGTLEDGEGRQPLSGFVFTLGHSRAMAADAATDQKLDTFLRLHEAAFETVGGVPEEILYDHVKTVVLGTDDRGDVRWHPEEPKRDAGSREKELIWREHPPHLRRAEPQDGMPRSGVALFQTFLFSRAFCPSRCGPKSGRHRIDCAGMHPYLCEQRFRSNRRETSEFMCVATARAPVRRRGLWTSATPLRQ